MNLTQCPYDGAKVEVEVSSGGSLLLTCVVCSAVWERHGAWTGRVGEPDREKLIEARRNGYAMPADAKAALVHGEPLPMIQRPQAAQVDGADGRLGTSTS